MPAGHDARRDEREREENKIGDGGHGRLLGIRQDGGDSREFRICEVRTVIKP